MKIVWRSIFSLFVVVVINSCIVMPEPNERRQVTLVYSGNLDGELEPCGCSEFGNQGGIKRRVSKVDELRRANPGLFLVSAGGLLISDLPQDRLTSQYILSGLQALDYDAIGVQWRDLAFGATFLSEHDLPLLASNWSGDHFLPERKVVRNGVTLTLFQWLDPARAPEGEMQGSHLPVSHDTARLAERLRVARSQGSVTLLATTLSLSDAQRQLPLDDVSILIIESNYELYGEPQLRDGMLVLQPGSRGMRLASVDFRVDGDGRVEWFEHEVISLPPTVVDAPRMAGWYDAYNREVKAAYEASVALRRAQRSGESPYAGAEACQVCHQAEYSRWQRSRHQHAFYALQDVNKAFDPSCIVCHTVGFNRDGGFIDPESTPERMHVQCESCHGAARDHVASGGEVPVERVAKTKAEVCVQCHNRSHSPEFSVEQYWPRISH